MAARQLSSLFLRAVARPVSARMDKTGSAIASALPFGKAWRESNMAWLGADEVNRAAFSKTLFGTPLMGVGVYVVGRCSSKVFYVKQVRGEKIGMGEEGRRDCKRSLYICVRDSFSSFSHLYPIFPPPPPATYAHTPIKRETPIYSFLYAPVLRR
uniref:Uncharacterized protein n=1 Tax=Palpitomonas bilix TaxID=652834 RepID=A0A7S3DEQ5_9EUKA|mmetsp:Transcript_34581/g.89656  ORF Transcript_34581/g.89656 Transcript_34581/m.89656 type:complete len:155 (+) Transcript_34581:245-709(+)